MGNNTFGPFTNSDGKTYTVVGYNAGRGYDLASGVGTIDAAWFVPALAGVGGH
jgi:kumamolisin